MSGVDERLDPQSGKWEPAQPLGWQRGIDFEVYGTGPFTWHAYDEDVLLAKGRARTRLGLAWQLRRAKRRLS